MEESYESQDDFIRNTQLVTYRDVFSMRARDNATMYKTPPPDINARLCYKHPHSSRYFAMRFCKTGIPAPMRFEVTVTPLNSTILPIFPWAAVCVASTLQDSRQSSNPALNSIKCESDVGEYGPRALSILA